MHFTWFSSDFFTFLKFSQIKDMGPNFFGDPIMRNGWIIWSPPLLYFNFKIFKDSNSMSFIICQCILNDSAGLFLYFNFRNCKGANSMLRIRFQYILHDLAVIFSDFQNFHKLKRGDLIYRGKNNSVKWLYYLVSPSVS